MQTEESCLEMHWTSLISSFPQWTPLLEIYATTELIGCCLGRVLDLEKNKIKSNSGGQFPTSLTCVSLSLNPHNLRADRVLNDSSRLRPCSLTPTLVPLSHLSLKNNEIGSIKGVTFTLNSCAVDANCQYALPHSSASPEHLFQTCIL